jgi:hypothetical protein
MVHASKTLQPRGQKRNYSFIYGKVSKYVSKSRLSNAVDLNIVPQLNKVKGEVVLVPN